MIAHLNNELSQNNLQTLLVKYIAERPEMDIEQLDPLSRAKVNYYRVIHIFNTYELAVSNQRYLWCVREMEKFDVNVYITNPCENDSDLYIYQHDVLKLLDAYQVTYREWNGNDAYFYYSIIKTTTFIPVEVVFVDNPDSFNRYTLDVFYSDNDYHYIDALIDQPICHNLKLFLEKNDVILFD